MDYPASIADVGLVDGKFSDGTPDGVTKPSRDPAAWANAVTDEILQVITDSGLVPDEADNTQLRQAIDAKIAAAIAGIALPDLTGYARLNLAQVWAAQQTPQSQVLADGATVAWDVALGQRATVTTAASRMIGAPTNLVEGTSYRLTIVSGGFTPSWNTVFAFMGGFVPTDLAGTCIFDFDYDGVKMRCTNQQYGVA